MKYRYLYQTKDNENREGWIKARSRENAYAELRRAGIRPYRLIGDDPLNWRPWAAACAILALSAALTVSLLMRDGEKPLPRRQLEGDAEVIASGVYCGWTNVFAAALDRRLAAYAQPGREVTFVAPSREDIAAMAADLGQPVRNLGGDRVEYAQLARIVEFMRGDLELWISRGGDIQGYLEYLAERQRDECDFREKAVAAVYRAPESMRYRAWLGVNARLTDMGIAPLEKPAGAEEDGKAP